jgi:hypothetical protein
VERKESIIVAIHNKGDKTDCSNYRGLSLLSTNVLQHSAVKVTPKVRGKSGGGGGPLVWNSTQQVNY